MELSSTRQLFLITTNINSKYSMKNILKHGTPLMRYVKKGDTVHVVHHASPHCACILVSRCR